MHVTPGLFPAVDGREYHWSDDSVSTCRVVDQTHFELDDDSEYWSIDDSLVLQLNSYDDLFIVDEDDEDIRAVFLPAQMAEGSRYVQVRSVDESTYQVRDRVVVRHRGTRTIETPSGAAVAHRIEVRRRIRSRSVSEAFGSFGAFAIAKRGGLGRWLSSREKDTFWLVQGVGPVRWKHAYRGSIVGRERFDRRLVELR